MVVAMSPPVSIGADFIQYSPPLPPARRSLCADMVMGSVIKTITVYPTAFWRAPAPASAAAAAASAKPTFVWRHLAAGKPAGSIKYGPIVNIFEMEVDGRPALIGFIAGERARDYTEQRLSSKQLQEIVTDNYARLFGAGDSAVRAVAMKPLHFVYRNWSEEHLSRGCYAGVCPPNLLTRVGFALTAPCGRIHWAGTETANSWNGHFEGALQSGERVAAEIAKRLAADKATTDLLQSTAPFIRAKL